LGCWCIYNGSVNTSGIYPTARGKGTVHTGHKVLVEVDDNSTLIVGDLQGILGKAAHASHNPLNKYHN
jgi:hypothetical protein